MPELGWASSHWVMKTHWFPLVFVLLTLLWVRSGCESGVTACSWGVALGARERDELQETFMLLLLVHHCQVQGFD